MFLFLQRNTCCPGCGAPRKELLQDTPVDGGSVAGTFLAGLAPELMVWLAVGVGLLAGGYLGVAAGAVSFALLLWGGSVLERRFTVYLCLRCGRRSRHDELVAPRVGNTRPD
jgi:hypothetical protein